LLLAGYVRLDIAAIEERFTFGNGGGAVIALASALRVHLSFEIAVSGAVMGHISALWGRRGPDVPVEAKAASLCASTI
jgi:hypothetical protein